MAKSTKYDRDVVIQKATALYWEKGFHGTSMRNLQDVIDMRPGSIYACFGSKEGLFKESLHHYADMTLELLAQCRSQSNSPLQTLKNFIKAAVMDTQSSAPSNMCMLVKTISELTEDNLDLLQQAKQLLGKIERAFTDILQDAQTKGEVAKNQDCQPLARYLQIQIMGLRTYLRANPDNINVDSLINDIFTYGPFQPSEN
ncbi:TetR/AcrR family transcriptional regulator [Vibrio rumoiensis]|uniref:TetR family transcriptional regulator n=1 Tax=Vibrio rumoiensis 1S-45 TaxID=1188252 RepID=A0A1E5E6Q7_9VIBR|nr:TetR/AcrR family transcriptional regulator [Vibrio rumoiensis]OEF30211.1 TetR family transcriptional regulator [Vibrio rumoiensis 1S-45]